eukprot:TRINITY_DN371_c4_g1_i1.p1 TRINITY_DN371_c4_g1~~TRINITY_DN371_c4_g1_i1.p1  ORF type:complete len:971 (+),score=261.93 TRINITY_DN371_c4_g1_i1:544-3456(+)
MFNQTLQDPHEKLSTKNRVIVGFGRLAQNNPQFKRTFLPEWIKFTEHPSHLLRAAGLLGLAHASKSFGSNTSDENLEELCFTLSMSMLNHGGDRELGNLLNRADVDFQPFWRKKEVYIVQKSAVNVMGILVCSNPEKWWPKVVPSFNHILENPSYDISVKTDTIANIGKFVKNLESSSPLLASITQLLLKLSQIDNTQIYLPAFKALCNMGIFHSQLYMTIKLLIEQKMSLSKSEQSTSSSPSTLLSNVNLNVSTIRETLGNFLSIYCKLIVNRRSSLRMFKLPDFYPPVTSIFNNSFSYDEFKQKVLVQRPNPPVNPNSNSPANLILDRNLISRIMSDDKFFYDTVRIYSSSILESVLFMINEPKVTDDMTFLRNLMFLIMEYQNKAKIGSIVDANDQIGFANLFQNFCVLPPPIKECAISLFKSPSIISSPSWLNHLRSVVWGFKQSQPPPPPMYHHVPPNYPYPPPPHPYGNQFPKQPYYPPHPTNQPPPMYSRGGREPQVRGGGGREGRRGGRSGRDNPINHQNPPMIPPQTSVSPTPPTTSPSNSSIAGRTNRTNNRGGRFNAQGRGEQHHQLQQQTPPDSNHNVDRMAVESGDMTQSKKRTRDEYESSNAPSSTTPTTTTATIAHQHNQTLQPNQQAVHPIIKKSSSSWGIEEDSNEEDKDILSSTKESIPSSTTPGSTTTTQPIQQQQQQQQQRRSFQDQNSFQMPSYLDGVQIPSISSADSSSSGKRIRRDQQQQQICKYWINRSCSQGDACPFLHEGQQIVKNEICKFHRSGSCVKGDSCAYSHDLSQEACIKMVESGRCIHGDKCRFSHDPNLIEYEKRKKLGQPPDKTEEETNNESYESVKRKMLSEPVYYHNNEESTTILNYTTKHSPLEQHRPPPQPQSQPQPQPQPQSQSQPSYQEQDNQHVNSIDAKPSEADHQTRPTTNSLDLFGLGSFQAPPVVVPAKTAASDSAIDDLKKFL